MSDERGRDQNRASVGAMSAWVRVSWKRWERTRLRPKPCRVQPYVFIELFQKGVDLQPIFRGLLELAERLVVIFVRVDAVLGGGDARAAVRSGWARTSSVGRKGGEGQQ